MATNGRHRRIVRRGTPRAGLLVIKGFALSLGAANMFLAGCWLAMDHPVNAAASMILGIIIPGAILSAL